MDAKSLCRVEIKDAAKGEVTAIFSTFDVIDSDNDVTLAGAFTDGAPVRISAYGHTSWEGALPVGKGVIRTTKSEAILEGQFFMDTAHGADTFRTVKALSDAGLQEWSYGYDPVKYSYGDFEGKQVRFLEQIKTHEVSPVMLGAGVGTRTLTTKSAPMTFLAESQAVLAALTGLSDRAASVLAMRSEKGKGFGSESADLLKQVESELKRFGVLLAPEPPPEEPGDLEREYLRFLANNLAKETAV